MAKPAYVILSNLGVVVKTHSTDVGGPAPTAGATDLEQLITLGYQQKREVPLTEGGMLVVLERP